MMKDLLELIGNNNNFLTGQFLIKESHLSLKYGFVTI